MKTHQIVLAASFFMLTPVVCGAVTLVNDTFDSGTTRTNRQNLPTSASWYGSATSNITLDTSAGTLTILKGNIATGYFTNSGTQTLNAGDSISLSMSFKLDASYDVANSIRVALFNSGGTRLSADGAGFNNDLYVDDTGYAAYFNPGSATTGGASIAEKAVGTAGTANGYITSAGGPVVQSGTSSTAAGPNLAANTDYTLTLSITRSLDGLSNQVTFNLNGITASYTDTTSPYISFDTAVLLYNPNTTGSFMTVNDISVIYTAVPEPSTIALMLGGLTVLAATLKRHRTNSSPTKLA